MSSTYSTSLRVELVGSGDQAGAWGSTTNGNFSNIFDVAIAGYQTVSVTSASQALTYLNGPTTTANLNQSVYAMLRFTTTTGAAFNVYAPPVSKQYIVYNNSGYSMILYNSTVIGNTTAAGTGVTVTNGAKVMVWSDGTNFYELQAANLTGTLAIANGGTGQTTANAAFNALAPSQTSANGKYLKSDGTNTSWDAIDISTSDISGVLLGANGGTGVANTGKTITLGGNLTTSGAFATTLTTTNTTNVTLPTTGTLATLAGAETLTNKTLTSPTFTAPVLGTPTSGNLANCTFPTLNQNTTGTAAGLSTTLAVASGGTGVTTAAAITSLVGNLLFPVGAIYTATVATNPGTLLGFGTWTAFGAGRVLIGNGGGFSAGATGGSADAVVVSHTHTGTTNGAGSHSHTYDDAYMAFFSGSVIGAGSTYNSAAYQFRSPTPSTSTIGDHTHTFTTGSSGVSGTNANLQPYIVVYMWQRTA